MASVVSIAREIVKKRFGKDQEMSWEQERVMKAVIGERNNVLFIPLTGKGKSLPFHIMMIIMCETVRELHGKGEDFPAEPIVVLVCPLLSLMESHKRELAKMGVSSTVLGDDKEGTLAGKYPVVMGCPEAWLQDQWKPMLLSPIYQERVVTCVTDEAHCIPKWGIDKVFEEAYARLGELRFLLPSGTPVLAMTASATKDTMKTIQRSLVMDKAVVIENLPVWLNIQLSVTQISTDIQTTFGPMINQLRTEKDTFEKTLIYCKTIKECALLYEMFSLVLSEDSYVDLYLPKTASNRLFGMYHPATREPNKQLVMDSLMYVATGAARVIFTTSALGKGVNMPDIRHVINYGPSADIESFIQESGRAGRDGLPSTAQLLYHSYHLVGAQPDLKSYMVRQDACRRKIILDDFPGEFMAPTELHQCCDFCAGKCECGACTDLTLPFQPVTPTVVMDQPVRTVNDSDTDDIKSCMEELNEMHTSELPSLFFPPEFITGITPGLIASVIDHAPYISSIGYVCEHIPVPSVRVASDIVDIFHELFDDFEYTPANLPPVVALCELDMNFADYVCSDSDWESD